jgi:hypothetical protein
MKIGVAVFLRGNEFPRYLYKAPPAEGLQCKEMVTFPLFNQNPKSILTQVAIYPPFTERGETHFQNRLPHAPYPNPPLRKGRELA